MKQNSDFKIKTLDIQSQFCFFDDTGWKWIEKLQSIASNPGDLDAVLLLRKEASWDFTKTWKCCRSKIFFDDLTHRIIAFRKLCNDIKNSSIPWVFAYDDHCMGSIWQLASSCQKILCFNSKTWIGFPDHAVFNSKEGHTSKTKGKLQKILNRNPLTPSYECYHKQKIDFIGDDPYWHKTIKGELPSYLKNSVPAKQKKIDFDRKKNTEASHIEASYFLSPLYQSHIDALNQINTIPHYKDIRVSSGPVYIDMDSVLPPKSSMKNLLENNINLLFFSETAEKLQVTLERLYLKLEKEMPTPQLKSLWDKHVNWYVGTPSIDSSTILKWRLDDFLEINSQGEKIEIYRLSGNTSYSMMGISEWPENSDAEISPNTLELLSNLTEQTIKTTPISGINIPITIWARSLVLEEMINICEHLTIDILTLLKELEKLNWGFSSSRSSWNRFIQTRYGTWSSIDKSDRLLLDLGPSRNSWDVGTFKHISQLIKKKNSVTTGWNINFASLHLAIFTGIIARTIHKQNLLGSYNATNVLIKNAIGLPDYFGSPIGLIENRGEVRISSYVKKHWPQFTPYI